MRCRRRCETSSSSLENIIKERLLRSSFSYLTLQAGIPAFPLKMDGMRDSQQLQS